MITVDVRRLTASTPLRGSGARVLDAGCGSGRHVGEAYRLAKAVVIGVDRDAADLSEAAARMQVHDRLGEHGGGTWALGAADILDLPFKNGCFDVVICSEVLEHIPDHRRAIREVLRVLKQGGSLAVSVPRTYPEKICWALSPDYRRSPGGHVRIYRKEKLVHLVEKAGARLLGTHFAHSLHTPYWWLKCLLGPNGKQSAVVEWYHRFLVWDMMLHPPATRILDRLLNPVLGKSIVCYFKKASVPVGRPQSIPGEPASNGRPVS